MAPLEKENLSDKLTKIISKQIIQNELKSGEIIYETQISKQWGVSRSPVRDALNVLMQQRLIERIPSGSYKVTELTREYLLNFYDTVNVLYRYIFSRVAERATNKEISSIGSSIKKIENSFEKKNFDQYFQGIQAFVDALLKAAENPIVERICKELMPTANRIMFTTISFSHDHFHLLVEHLKQGFRYITEKKPQEAADSFTSFAGVNRDIALKSLEELESGMLMDHAGTSH